MRLRWLTLLAAPVAALVLLGAACGGGDDDDGDSGDDDGAATATLDSGDGGDSADEETPEATAEDEGDDDSGDDSAAGAVDACSLVTGDEAEAALGSPVSDGEVQEFPPVYSCTYRPEEFGLVIVSVLVYDNDEQAEITHQAAIDNNEYEEIDGIGESAYFALGFGITALQGKYEVTVDVAGPDNDRELEEELAKVAVERLP